MIYLDPKISDVLHQFSQIRAEAVVASHNSPEIVSIISRFLGKAHLLLEAFVYETSDKTVGLVLQETLGELSDAINSIAEIFSFVGRMSRMEALIHVEDINQGLKAAAADLRAAVAATLAPLGVYLPLDAKEDLCLLQRQLASLKISTGSDNRNRVLAVEELLYELTLQQQQQSGLNPLGISIPPPTMNSRPMGSMFCSPALHKALVVTGLAALPVDSWLQKELDGLQRGAIEARESKDYLLEYHLKCIYCALQRTFAVITSPATNSNDNSRDVECIRMDCRALCKHLIENDDTVDDITNNGHVRKYQAAVFIRLYAENGYAAELMQCKVLEALLCVLDGAEGVKQLQRVVHPSVRTAAALALRTLCRDSSVRDAAMAAGILSTLSRHLQSPLPGLRRACARAICNLLVSQKSTTKQEAAEKYSITQSLVAMLRSDDTPLALEAAASALANLAANSKIVQLAIGRTDVFTALLDVLKMRSEENRDGCFGGGANNSVQLLSVTLRALCNLTSKAVANKIKATEVGSIPIIVSILKNSSSLEYNGYNSGEIRRLQIAAAFALSTLMDGCIEAVREALDAKAHYELIDMLQGGKELGEVMNQQTELSYNGADVDVIRVKERAACALIHIIFSASRLTFIPTKSSQCDEDALDNNTILSLLDTRSIPSLLVVLQRGSLAGRQTAAKIITQLIKHKASYKDIAVRNGVVPLLVSLLLVNANTASSSSLQLSAASALCVTLQKNDEARKQFIECGGIQSTVALLFQQDYHDAKDENKISREDLHRAVKAKAARLLAVLCANNNFNQGELVRDAGAIPALLQMILCRNGRVSNSPCEQEAAAVALSNLACVPENKAELIGAGKALLYLVMSSKTNNSCRQAAARGLSNLVADGLPVELESKISDMVQALMQLTENENEETQVVAAGALGNIACVDAASVARWGGADALATMCRSETPSVREAGAQGLWEVCRGSEDARKIAISSGTVPWLVQLLVVGEDAGKEAAAGCLAELTRSGESVCLEAEKAGAVGLLDHLSKYSENPDVRGASMAALKALQQRSPDSPSVAIELTRMLTSLKKLGSSKRWDVDECDTMLSIADWSSDRGSNENDESNATTTTAATTATTTTTTTTTTIREALTLSQQARGVGDEDSDDNERNNEVTSS